MNGFLTEPIILSGDQSAEFINSLCRPDKEYLIRRDEIFAKMDKEISIEQNGKDMMVEIPDLDLSFIDEMNTEKDIELTSNIEIRAEYCLKVESVEIFKRLFSTNLKTISNFITATNALNKIIYESYMNNEEAYVKAKNNTNMTETDKTEQEQIALAS